jgi:hypothetical protein
MAEDKKEEDKKGLNEFSKDAAINFATRAVLNKIKKKTQPKYETPSSYLPSSKKDTILKGSYMDNMLKEKEQKARTEKLLSYKPKKLDPSVFKKPENSNSFLTPYYEKHRDFSNLSDNILNDLSKNTRSNIYHRLKYLNENPSDRYVIKKEIELARKAEQELQNRNYEKVARKSQHLQNPSTRKFYWQKGHRTLRSIPYIGTALGLLTSPSADAAIDLLGSEEIGYDAAIEDPNSLEFRKRQLLLKALRGE